MMKACMEVDIQFTEDILFKKALSVFDSIRKEGKLIAILSFRISLDYAGSFNINV